MRSIRPTRLPTGTTSKVGRFEQKDFELTAYADDEFKLGQVRDVLGNKLAKRGVDARLVRVRKAKRSRAIS